MKISRETISYEQTGYFSAFIADYIKGEDKATKFYKYPVSIDSFAQVIKDKQTQTLDRELLVKVLKQQYQNYTGADFEKIKGNIELLKSDKTFTVVTAHQPNLFLGPLYTLYKTVSVINLAEQLKAKYPDYNFVPAFWIGSEDHDFAELNHIHLFGKTIAWNAVLPENGMLRDRQAQDDPGGAFGRRNTSGLKPMLEEVMAVLGEVEQANQLKALLNKAYTEEKTIAEATRRMLFSLFNAYGLVVVDGDSAELKRQFLPVIKEELFNQRSFQLVEATGCEIEKHYEVQAKPREINLFYLSDKGRNRIVKEGENWKVLNTDTQFSKEQLEHELDEHPERFSPNVILRPLYQETIMPSVAFIGGGAEVAYFSEMKALFEHFKVNYPVVVLRNSVLWVDSTNYKKWLNTGFDIGKLFTQTDTLVNEFVKQQAQGDINTKEETLLAENLFRLLKSRIESLDKSILPMVEGEEVRFKKFLDTFEDKLLKAEKRKHETSTQQIRSVKEKLFPNNSLQERYDNFIPYYLKYGQEFVTALKDNLDPLEQQFTVLMEG